MLQESEVEPNQQFKLTGHSFRASTVFVVIHSCLVRRAGSLIFPFCCKRGVPVSIDLNVYVVRPPKDLRSLWEQAFADCGMKCEFRLDFDPVTWTGGDLIAKMQVSERGFPGSELYGERPFVAGCGMDMYRAPDFNEERDDLLARCPRPLQPKLKKATVMCLFSTSMGRGPAAWRFQVFAAATLAKVTHGIFYDPQGGIFYPGDEATELAQREAEYEDKEAAARLRKTKTLNLQRFRSWTLALKEVVPEYAED